MTIEELTTLLHSQRDLTLAVSRNGETRTFTRRGVADLLDLLKAGELEGAMVADKIVGKAAASLIIKGGVKEVHTDVITTGAKQLLKDAGIKTAYETEVDQVDNRDKTGRCPLDTICEPLIKIDDMIAGISKFYDKNSSKQ